MAVKVQMVGSVADGAFAIGNTENPVTRDRMVVEAALRFADTFDVIRLAQASMALARAVVQAKLAGPVLTGPETAVARLKALLSE